MAEYYPLLAKAVGSLPNSTPDTRRVVYERARKALIGQLRIMHPPIPDEDIDRESVELDRAIERIETELAATAAVAPAESPPGAASSEAPSQSVPDVPPTQPPATPRSPMGTLGPVARKPIVPLRPPSPRPLRPPPSSSPAVDTDAAGPDRGSSVADVAENARDVTPARDGAPAEDEALEKDTPANRAAAAGPEAGNGRPRVEAQRPIAPMPQIPKGTRRRLWILPAGIAVVVLAVGAAAWKLRVRPETLARNAPVATQPQSADTGKIADRVGGEKAPDTDTTATPDRPPTPASQPAPDQGAPPTETAKREATPPPPINPAVPVAYRAALLVEAPDLPSKVQTFPGTVVWKLNNVNAGPSDAVGLSVEADIDLPQDKTKATVVFERNTDASLPASHTIKVRFTIDPGSYSGDVKQISVPQMRREGNSDGEPLAGVTVPVIQNSFLVGLSPGNAETANLRLINELPWVDVPILLNSGKIAKLTFEKGAAGQRDIAEAMSYWQKQ